MDAPNIKDSIALVWFAQACHVAVRDEAVHYLYGVANGDARADRAQVAMRRYYADVLTPLGHPGRVDYLQSLRRDFDFGFGTEHTAPRPNGENVTAFLADLHGMAMLAYAKSQQDE